MEISLSKRFPISHITTTTTTTTAAAAAAASTTTYSMVQDIT
jgi:hypothetical protein